MPTSPDEMMTAMLKNIIVKTGHDMNYWIKIAKDSGETKHMAIIKYLKWNHGMTHGYANFVAFKLREGDTPAKTDDQIFKDQYAKKPELKPIYDHIEKIILNLGKDITKRVCKGYVAFLTTKQFAILKPSTKTRLDVGFMLKGRLETDRFKVGKVFSGMMTHHAEIFSMNDIDNELKEWLKSAYEKASKSN